MKRNKMLLAFVLAMAFLVIGTTAARADVFITPYGTYVDTTPTYYYTTDYSSSYFVTPTYEYVSPPTYYIAPSTQTEFFMSVPGGTLMVPINW